MGIPEHIDADISSLEVGGTIRLEEIPAIEGVTYLDDPETVLATCAISRAAIELEEADAEAEAVAETEGEGGSEGDGDGATGEDEQSDSE